MVKKTIKEISSKNSNGHDTIFTNFLKRIADIIAEPLKRIINKSLCTGIFSHRLKLAKVVPLFKKGDPNILDNYRLISILSAFSKVLEKVYFHQTYAYLTENKLLYSGQYSFRKAHSTELASIELVDRISKHLDSGKLPISVFLDLPKAFDTLDHSILLTKLHHYGFQSTPMKWFHSYLKDRSQYVDYDGTMSKICSITTRVPQWSILGHLLFIIYMNGIHEANPNFKAILHADDTNLISSLCPFSNSASVKDMKMEEISVNINNELDSISEWLSINMLFHFHRRNVNSFTLKLALNSEPIERGWQSLTFLA